MTKAQIFNLALQALLLQRQISDADTDGSNEAKVLRTNWDVALATALADMDLDSTSTQADLVLIQEDPNDLWGYSYTYPTDCVHFRRLQSSAVMDNEATHIDKAIRIKSGVKCIFTNQEDAIIEYISKNVPLTTLSSAAGYCVALKLAKMAAPLITGKGASKLIEQLNNAYVVAKAEAQENDQIENFVYIDPLQQSSWARERTE